MRLKIRELQRIVDRAFDEREFLERLKSEVVRAFGTAVVSEGTVNDVITEATIVLDSLEARGRGPRAQFNTSIALKLLESPSELCRTFAVRVLPETHIRRAMRDSSDSVALVLVKRLPLNEARRLIMNRDDGDNDLLEVTYNARLTEAKAGKLEKVRDERLGDCTKQQDVPSLSDAWYLDKARDIVYDYGRTMDTTWVEPAVAAFCRNTRLSSKVDVDGKKLLKAVKDILDEYDDNIVNSPKQIMQTIAYLRERAGE